MPADSDTDPWLGAFFDWLEAVPTLWKVGAVFGLVLVCLVLNKTAQIAKHHEAQAPERERQRAAEAAQREKNQAAEAAALARTETDFLTRWRAWQLARYLAPPSLNPADATAHDRAAFLADYLNSGPADAWRLRSSVHPDVVAITGDGRGLPRNPAP